MQTSALAIPPSPHPAGFVPASGAADAPHVPAVPSADALTRADLSRALIYLAAVRHRLAKAREWAHEAERTHTEPVTGPGGRLYVRAHAYSPEDIAQRRAHSAARVAECERRVQAAHRRVESLMWAARDTNAQVPW